MPTLTHEKISEKISKKYNTQKNFFPTKNIYPKFFSYPKYAYIRDGDSPPILFTFENFAPQKSPFLRFFRFCTFLCAFSESRACSSGYVQIFIHFRTNPILYNNLYILGICACLPCSSIFALYRNGRGRGICSDFVFILFIFGNMIQKAEFVYNCRKKVKKSIAI